MTGMSAMNYGNSKKVMADAVRIAERLRSTSTTVTQLQKEYHCGYAALMCSVRSQISAGEYEEIRIRKLTQGTRDTGFKKGHIAWNKGLRGVHFSPTTEFKKGHLPADYKQVNTITVRKDTDGKKFRWIKTSNVPKSRHNWIPYASHIWQKKNGPIPKGHFVIHADGDRLNDDIDNLLLVDHKGHFKLQLKRDPSIVQRMRHNSSVTNRRRHAANRGSILAARKERAEFRKQEQIASRKRQRVQQALQQLRAVVASWWECIGCGQDYGSEPPAICHKCNGLRFALIKHRKTG